VRDWCTKIKLENVSEGITISSLEATIPKLLTAAGHRVVKMNQSHWMLVLTWREWEEPNAGYKVTLTDHLNAIRESHKEAINIDLEPGSKFHSLCILALTDSCSFLESFLNHFDNWQHKLMLSKFGQAKALRVNTRGGSHFWDLLAQPGAGVSRMLKTGNPQQITQVTFWSTLPCHEPSPQEQFQRMTQLFPRICYVSHGQHWFQSCQANGGQDQGSQRSQQGLDCHADVSLPIDPFLWCTWSM
jgi:hypothetical protein